MFDTTEDHWSRIMSEFPVPPSMTALRTKAAAERAADIKYEADLLTSDRHRGERLFLQHCPTCHYTDRRSFAGQAETHWRCGLCGSRNKHSTTNAPRLCLACATQHNLCTMCGGDFESDVTRTEYPSPTFGVERVDATPHGE